LGAFCVNQANMRRRYLVVGQRLFTVAFALDTAVLPSRFCRWRQYSGLLRTIGHFLQYKQVREFTAGGGDSQVKRKATNSPFQPGFIPFRRLNDRWGHRRKANANNRE